MAVLLTPREILDRVSPVIDSKFAGQLEADLFNVQTEDVRSQNAKNWLSWTYGQQNLRQTEVSIPDAIIPPRLRVTLTDVRVLSKGPDDRVYDRNPKFRERVARGNCVLEVTDTDTAESSADCVIFALKKFTGGLGDDDDRDISDGFKFEKYFSRPITEAEQVICTRKMNGEAAHFAVRWLNGEFYIIAGSKNVHLLFRSVQDLEKYTDSRYLVAREVAKSCFDFFREMEPDKRNALFSFFHITKFTAVLEILQPHYQHIEDLSALKASKLVFISWSRTDLQEGIYEAETCIRPDYGQEMAKAFGLATTQYKVVPHKSLHDHLTVIRKGHGFEGEVLYFLDKDGKVIGLLKKKTIWYIIVRAIREKTKSGVARIRKNPTEKLDVSDAQTKTKKRLREIRKWLDLDREAAQQWEELADGFMVWLGNALKTKSVDSKDIFGLYPVVWTRYLRETGRTDAICVEHITLADDPDSLDASAAAEAEKDVGAGDADEDSVE